LLFITKKNKVGMGYLTLYLDTIIVVYNKIYI
jgi:hypothetical protein